MLKTFAFFVLDTLVTRSSRELTAERLQMYRLLDQPRHVAGTVTIAGRRFQYPDAASCFSAWRFIFDDHCYLFDNPSESPVILDIGANIGLASFYFSLRYPKARIVAFEPASNLFQLLRTNLLGLPGVETRRIAIAGYDGEAAFLETDDDSGSIIAESTIIESQKSHRAQRVPCQRLSSVLEEFDKIDLLKIDIEGAETQAIVEAASRLDRVARMFVEFHSFRNQPQALSSLLAILENCGFRYVIQSESIKRSPFVIRETQETIDAQVNIYATRTGVATH